jgi:predicted ABC-type transport system involved in lysophospholipase L1 biosynthesis ATPase subunit
MTAVVSVQKLVKNYQALRPLRIQQLTVDEAHLVSVFGLDAAAAEVFVGLLTGALVPDEGEVRLFGRSTAHIDDSEAWLAMLDGIGIVTERAVLIEAFTVEQNIAMPFTLEVDPVRADVKPLVEALGHEVGLASEILQVPVARAGDEARVRVRLARALALDPKLLLAEHPSASLPREAVTTFAADLARIGSRRRLAVLTITADSAFAKALGGQLLTHEPATGALKPLSVWRKLFG